MTYNNVSLYHGARHNISSVDRIHLHHSQGSELGF